MRRPRVSWAADGQKDAAGRPDPPPPRPGFGRRGARSSRKREAGAGSGRREGHSTNEAAREQGCINPPPADTRHSMRYELNHSNRHAAQATPNMGRLTKGGCCPKHQRPTRKCSGTQQVSSKPGRRMPLPELFAKQANPQGRLNLQWGGDDEDGMRSVRDCRSSARLKTRQSPGPQQNHDSRAGPCKTCGMTPYTVHAA